MDKNTITGLVLIAAIVIGFSILNKPSQEEIDKQKKHQDSIENAQKTQVKEEIASDSTPVAPTENQMADFFSTTSAKTDSTLAVLADTIRSTSSTLAETDQIVSLENDKVKINFTTKGGQMLSVQLKDYKTYKGDSLYLSNADTKFALELMNKKGVTFTTAQVQFTPITASGSQTLTMRMNYGDKQHIDFIYALSPDSYMLKFNVAVVGMKDILSQESNQELKLKWSQNLRRQEKNAKNEQRYAHAHYKLKDGSVESLSDSSNDKLEVSVPVKWVSFKDQYFATTIIADNEFSIIDLNSKIVQSADYLKDYDADLYFKPVVSTDGALSGSFRIFTGPLDYYMLKSYDDGVAENAQKLEMDKLIPLGWSLFRIVNQWFIIPLFDLLHNTGIHLGIVILLLTLIVKVILSPLTYKSFMSSAKMRVLKPQIEVINEKYPGQEKAMERQKATMALYGQAGVNPMSGCLPMLLQMPILIALFSFFPSAIELRQESFLWATDLSTYDAIIEWKMDIPFLSSLLDNHLSLFCVLMTATNIVYTKFNMDQTGGQEQMPGMKWMMMLMPLVFFFVLNSYPSGLTYYYFLSTLITILITLSFRMFVDEDKVLAKLEENKKKPKKKGFMSRLQEQAEQAQRQQGKGQNKGGQNKKK